MFSPYGAGTRDFSTQSRRRETVLANGAPFCRTLFRQIYRLYRQEFVDILLEDVENTAELPTNSDFSDWAKRQFICPITQVRMIASWIYIPSWQAKHTHTQVSLIPPWEDQREWHRMTRMTRPDCAVMCNLINTHTHTLIQNISTDQNCRTFFASVLVFLMYLRYRQGESLLHICLL